MIRYLQKKLMKYFKLMLALWNQVQINNKFVVGNFTQFLFKAGQVQEFANMIWLKI